MKQVRRREEERILGIVVAKTPLCQAATNGLAVLEQKQLPSMPAAGKVPAWLLAVTSNKSKNEITIKSIAKANATAFSKKHMVRFTDTFHLGTPAIKDGPCLWLRVYSASTTLPASSPASTTGTMILTLG